MPSRSPNSKKLMSNPPKKSSHFEVPGSPLNGRRVPRDWNRLELPGKWKALEICGYAESYVAARKVMGKHAAAVAKLRAERKKREEEN